MNFELLMNLKQIDQLWILISTILILLMQIGFLALESGLTRTKNNINVAYKNFIDLVISNSLFLFLGFSLMYGNSLAGFIGNESLLSNLLKSPSLLLFAIFQTQFCCTAVTIVSGSIAERSRLMTYVIITIAISLFIYPVVGHLIWNTQGALYKIGFIDYAGSTVVHSVGGWSALAAVIIIGPRIGFFSDKKSFNPNSLPFALLGVLLMTIGWIGFNGGSRLHFDSQVIYIIMNTLFCGFASFLVIFLFRIIKSQKIDIVEAINCFLGGLVAVTASCHLFNIWQSIALGICCPLIILVSEKALTKFKIDDAIGVIPVHLACGIFGTLALSLHRSTFDSFLRQLGIQVLGVMVVGIITFGIIFILLFSLNKIWPLRVSKEEEEVGLNISQHGASTDLNKLLHSMEEQVHSHDLSVRVEAVPFSEVGIIASFYNKVLDSLEQFKMQQDLTVKRSKQIALSQMSATLAHEINNPLAISTNSAFLLETFLKKHHDVYKDLKKYFTNMTSANNRISKIIQSLEKYSTRCNKDNYQSWDLAELLNKCIYLNSNHLGRNKIEVYRKNPPSQPLYFKGSEQCILEAFMVLFENAIESLQNHEGKREITIEISTRQKMCSIIFGDSGKGIASMNKEKVFEPFFTSKPKESGGGVGLSISRNMFENHGGSIHYIGDTNRSTFEIQLPLIPQADSCLMNLS